MSYCASNINEVIQYVRKDIAISYANLSSQITPKVINLLRSGPIETDKVNQKFMELASKNNITVFAKDHSFEYDKSPTNPVINDDVPLPKDFETWISTVGVKKDDLTVVKNFNWIFEFLFHNYKQPLLFENGKGIRFGRNWPSNVTVARVKEIVIDCFIPDHFPINDLTSVETVRYLCVNCYLTFILLFTRLKRLIIDGENYHVEFKPYLPYLEELYLSQTSLIVDTENLRKLELENNIFLDDEITKFIWNQKRLLFLKVSSINYGLDFRFPSSIKTLIWIPEEKVEEIKAKQYVNHLIKTSKKLKLRHFETNLVFENIKWMNTTKIKEWSINDSKREKVEGKWVFRIFDYKKKLPGLNITANEWIFMTDSLLALKLVYKGVTKLTLEKELKGKIKILPVLKHVKNLILNYKVTDNQAQLLERIFPQFTKKQLKEKGKKKDE